MYISFILQYKQGRLLCQTEANLFLKFKMGAKLKLFERVVQKMLTG